MLWRPTSEDLILIVHFTRNWLHYGAIGFVCGCAAVSALKGVFS